MNLQAAFLKPPVRTYVICYAEAHQHKVNQRHNLFGIPLLTISVIGLLARVRFESVDLPMFLQPNFGLALMSLVCSWYLWASPVAGSMLLVVAVACYTAGLFLSLPWLGAIAV